MHLHTYAISDATLHLKRMSPSFRFRDPSMHQAKASSCYLEDSAVCLRPRYSLVTKKTGMDSFSSGLVRVAAWLVEELGRFGDRGWL